MKISVKRQRPSGSEKNKRIAAAILLLFALLFTFYLRFPNHRVFNQFRIPENLSFFPDLSAFF